MAARRVSGAKVTILQDGGIHFDAETYGEMGGPQACYLMFEERTRTIGVQAGSADDQTAVMVKSSCHRKGRRCVRSMQFLMKCGVDLSRSWRLPFAYVEDGVLVLELKTAVEIGRRWKQMKAVELRREANKEKLDDRERIRVERVKQNEKLAADRAKLKADREKARATERKFEERTRQIERIKRRYGAIYGDGHS